MKKEIKILKLPFSETNLGSIFYLILNVLSVMVSWYFNKSILWAIVHYFIAVPYLVYRLLIGSFTDGAFFDIIKSYF